MELELPPAEDAGQRGPPTVFVVVASGLQTQRKSGFSSDPSPSLRVSVRRD